MTIGLITADVPKRSSVATATSDSGATASRSRGRDVRLPASAFAVDRRATDESRTARSRSARGSPAETR